MTITLIQKLLTAVVVLTTMYSTLIFLVYYDLIRPISKSIFNLLPGFIFLGLGIAVSFLLNKPDLIFAKILPLKSGFARGILGSSVFPLVGASVYTLSIIASLSSFIDKMWFYWRSKRLFFLIRMICIIAMIIVSGNTLFKIIFTDQAAIMKHTGKLQKLGVWSAAILGVILLLVTILAIPNIFSRKKEG